MIFAAIAFAIGGLDEILVDLIWFTRAAWRRVFIFSRHDRVTLETLAPPVAPGRLAVFIAAWDEKAVIGPMLRHLVREYGQADYHVFVGCYPNDPDTIAAVNSLRSANISTVINTQNGPTTKADNLNHLWRALLARERDSSTRFKSIVLHDAEDVVHRGEPAIYDRMVEMFSMVQLPVYPLPDKRSRWVGGHYCDEFAEAHAKALVVREAIGAGLPAAGVGCALSREIIQTISDRRGGAPFDADTLTEDYELGLRIKVLGGRTAIVRIRETAKGPVVAIRAHFPATLSTAVRQKTRWIIGIALAGWDRMGWGNNWFENWMRLRDRRAPFAAIVIVAGYVSLLLFAVLLVIDAVSMIALKPYGLWMNILLMLNGGILIWRMTVRASFVAHDYGWREGLRSVPRTVVGNIIAIMAARRAVIQYWRVKTPNDLTWDKTEHHFPDVGAST